MMRVIKVFNDGSYLNLDVSRNNIHVDRVFVTPENRGRKRSLELLRFLSKHADTRGITLSVCIAPDGYGQPWHNKVVDCLESHFVNLGFQSSRIGKDVYRLDKVRQPNQQ